MSELTLVSPHQHPLKPLVEAALTNELRLLEAGIRKTEKRLNKFEAKYKMPTNEFIQRFKNDVLEETLDIAEWVGESRLLTRLQEKVDILQGIEFAN